MKGRKTGGRAKGTPNRTTIAKKALAEHIAKRGMTPLEYMLRVMRNGRADPARRDDMAKAAAPYIHPRLNAIQHTGKDGEPIAVSFTGLDAGAL